MSAQRAGRSAEQEQFAASLHDMLAAADVPAAARRWADGDPRPGWRCGGGWPGSASPRWPCRRSGAASAPARWTCGRLRGTRSSRRAGPGGGVGRGRAPAAARRAGRRGRRRTVTHGARGEWLAALAAGDLIATLAMPPWLPFAADAEPPGLVLLAEAGRSGEHRQVARRAGRPAPVGGPRPARCPTSAGARCWPVARPRPAPLPSAFEAGTLACAAQLLGAGRALLEASVRHAGSARSSAGRSGRSRRSSTSWPTWRSGWSSPARCSTRPPSRSAAGDRGAAGCVGREGRLRRRGPPGGPRRAAGARRDRLHRRARPQPVADQGPRAGRGLGQPGRAPGAASWPSSPPRMPRHGADRRAAGPAGRGPRAADPPAGRRTGTGRPGPGLRSGPLATALRRDRRRRAGHPRALRRRRRRPGRDPRRHGGTRPEPDPVPDARLGGPRRPGPAGVRRRRGVRAAAARDRRRHRDRGPGLDRTTAGHWDPPESGVRRATSGHWD